MLYGLLLMLTTEITLQSYRYFLEMIQIVLIQNNLIELKIS